MNAHTISNRLTSVMLLAWFATGCMSTYRGHGWAGRYPARRPAAPPDGFATAKQYDERRDQMQFQLAEARWRKNDVVGCRQLLEEIAERNPQHRGAHLRLAELRLLNNQPAKALQLMQRFCYQHRNDAEAHHLLGLCHEALGKHDAALIAYQRAVKIDPEEVLYRTSLETAFAPQDKKSVDKSVDFTKLGVAEHKASSNKSSAIQASATERPDAGNVPRVQRAYQLEADDAEESEAKDEPAPVDAADHSMPELPAAHDADEAPADSADPTEHADDASPAATEANEKMPPEEPLPSPKHRA